MRLVLATPLYPPEIGGPATYAKELCDGLPALGVEVVLVKFSDVRHLPKVLRHYIYYRRVFRAAKDADIVLALDPVSVGLPAMRAARKAKKPFVVKIVGDYAWEQGQQRFGVTATLDEFVKNKNVPMGVRALRSVQTRVAHGATCIIVPSEYLKEILVAWGIQVGKVSVIYNAATFETLAAVPQHVAALAKPLIVTAGRLLPWKHIDGVIDAVAQVRKREVAASLVVIGDGPERAHLEQRAHKELASNFLFTGAVSHAEALAILKTADIFVLNSSYEGLSHFLIEAQMLGVPTVATRVGGNPEVIREIETGVLIPAGAPKSLAAALEELLANGGRRARLSVSAQAASTRFSKETMLSKTKELLTSLI